jgi:hypothetical protein
LEDFAIMKSILSLIALCCIVSLTGCNNNKNATASPGAVGNGECTKGEACCQKEGAANMGAVGEKKEGCCSQSKEAGASMGAVGEKKECGSVCPATGKTTEGASLGAVSEKKSGCCSGKTGG